MEISKSLINRICSDFSDGVHFSAPIPSLRTNEVDLVLDVLRILQGFSSHIFCWDHIGHGYHAKSGIYVSHLSYTSLHVILNQFTCAATCFKTVEMAVNKVETSVRLGLPTLRAFAFSVSSWLKRLREIALKEEEKIGNSDNGTVPTLLGLAGSLSSLCSGAECLLQIVDRALPQVFFKSDCSVPAAEMSVHVLDNLYNMLTEVSLVQDGEEEAYLMLLFIFVGSLFPYIEVLDSWIYEGVLDDSSEEIFFYANQAISINEAEFWQQSYLMREKQFLNLDAGFTALTCSTNRQINSLLKLSKEKEKDGCICLPACPLFIKDIATSVVSAGKSLQLIRHLPTSPVASSKRDNELLDGFRNCMYEGDMSKIDCRKGMSELSLSEVFCVSLAALVGHGDHISKYFSSDYLGNPKIAPPYNSQEIEQIIEQGNSRISAFSCSEKIWFKFLVDTLSQKGMVGQKFQEKDSYNSADIVEENMILGFLDKLPPPPRSYPENPVINVCQTVLCGSKDTWRTLNLSKNSCLPPLNDEPLREIIFGEKNNSSFAARGTNYALGFQFGECEYLRKQDEIKLLETLFPFPTLLPPFQEDLCISDLLPFQKNSTLLSRFLSWIQSAELKLTPLPVVIMQECLITYIKNQVDYIGKHILSKLMNDWRLMGELGVLRAVYLLGSGDLLQHFFTVIFSKLDKGEFCDDDFELNMILQESIRHSAEGMLLSGPDSLVVSVSRSLGFRGNELHSTDTSLSNPRKSREHNFGTDGLDSLTFTYKMPWPLDLIVNREAIKKYNQVMQFLLKVKHAKFVLDKARRWMWKARGTVTANSKRHWLVEQKLVQFVNAFHQYAMDRVYHSAWRELCEGIAVAGSLDEVMRVHEAYLLSIRRQCFFVPDNLRTLIASRINSILGLALDFYFVQKKLGSGGAVLANKARCESEVDRIEKQFDDCIAFLLRVLSFRLNVGNFPHLADLVTRINYNYFYMPDGHY